jgi:hypothetical protein
MGDTSVGRPASIFILRAAHPRCSRRLLPLNGPSSGEAEAAIQADVTGGRWASGELPSQAGRIRSSLAFAGAGSGPVLPRAAFPIHP